jgi:hypothetical protein
MTGAEHYAEAERLLIHAENPNRLAAAQVHATLALAAATDRNRALTQKSTSMELPPSGTSWLKMGSVREAGS